MVTFIHTSDWQLGMTRWFLEADGSDAQARYSEDRLASIDKIGELAKSHNAEFIVVAGDVFESNTLPAQPFRRALDRIKNLPVPVYLLPGNHDAFDASSIYRRSEFEELANHGVTILTDSTPITVRSGVEIVGAPLRSKYVEDDPLASVLRELPPTDGVRIVVGHGQVEGFGNETAGLINLSEVDRAIDEDLIHYVAMGDTHSTRQLDARGYMWFSGTPETTDFIEPHGGGESDSGNVLIVDVEKNVPPKVKKIRTGQWDFIAKAADCIDFGDVEAFLADLESVQNKTKTCIKYSITGTVTISEMAQFENQLANLATRFGALFKRKSGKTLTSVADIKDVEALGLSGYPYVAAKNLAEQSQGTNPDGSIATEAEQTIAADALRLLARIVGSSN